MCYGATCLCGGAFPAIMALLLCVWSVADVVCHDGGNLVGIEIIKDSDMVKRKRSRGGLAPDKHLSDAQVKRVRAYVKNQAELARQRGSKRAIVNEMIIEFGLFTGLRAAEIINVTMQDLPGHHGKNEVYVRDGKGHVSRPVLIPTVLVERIAKFCAECRKGSKPKSPLFASEYGHRLIVWRTYRKRCNRKRGQSKYIATPHREWSARLTYESLYSKIKTIGTLAGIGRLTPHVLRHTYLTRLYGIEHDLRFCQDQAGHASITTTQIYTRTSDPDRFRQVDRLD